MSKPVEIALLVLVPLVWGVGIEYLFELVRRLRARRDTPRGGRPS